MSPTTGTAEADPSDDPRPPYRNRFIVPHRLHKASITHIVLTISTYHSCQQLHNQYPVASAKMPSLDVQPCTAEDMPRVFEIVSLAFANDHEYVDAVFPLHATPAGRKAGGERMLHIFQGDPYGHFMKVVDNDTGTIIAAAKWNIYNGNIPPQPEIGGDYWENEEEKEFAQALFWGFFAPRQKVIEETNGRLVGMLRGVSR